MFHFDKLRPFRPRPAGVGEPFPPPPQALIQAWQAWYKIDRIVRQEWRWHCQRDDQRQLRYKVLFKDCSDTYNVLRPASLLEGQECTALAYYPIPPSVI